MNPFLKLFHNLIDRGFEFFGRYYSSYRGFVISNNDPEGYGRVKLKVPNVYGTQLMNYWAWPKNCYSGKGYGIQCIPSIGDMVWVEFEMGDPRKPIWAFGHFASTTEGEAEKPQELVDINNFWFKTPGGHIVEFDDTNKWVRVKNSKGLHITMDEDGISLVSDKISLVELGESDEPAVLGDSNEDVLKDLQSNLKSLCETLIQIGTTDSTVASNIGLTYAATLVATLPNMLAQINAIQTKISKTKSTKVTLS